MKLEDIHITLTTILSDMSGGYLRVIKRENERERKREREKL